MSSTSPARGPWLPSIPLSIAVAALVAREVARPPEAPPVEAGTASELALPSAFLAFASRAQPERSFLVDETGSRVWLTVPGVDAAPRPVEGSVWLLDDGSIDRLELVVETPEGPVRVRGGRAGAVDCGVPGFRAGRIDVLVEHGGTAAEGVLELAWAPLPGGWMRVQGAGTTVAPRNYGLFAAGEALPVLAIDLALH